MQAACRGGPTLNAVRRPQAGAGRQAAGSAFQKSMGVRGLADISEEMQFELQVLEVILDYVTAFMEHLTSDIEAVAYPGLDAIVVKVSSRASALTRPRHHSVSVCAWTIMHWRLCGNMCRCSATEEFGIARWQGKC